LVLSSQSYFNHIIKENINTTKRIPTPQAIFKISKKFKINTANIPTVMRSEYFTVNIMFVFLGISFPRALIKRWISNESKEDMELDARIKKIEILIQLYFPT
jgi:hypothetical protein